MAQFINFPVTNGYTLASTNAAAPAQDGDNLVPAGDIAIVKLILYGMSSKGLLKCVILESARWCDEDVRKFNTMNSIDNLKKWIREKSRELESKAESLKATPGKYEVLAWQ